MICEDAESTKFRIVYDCSAKQNPQQPSLNDYLDDPAPVDISRRWNLWIKELHKCNTISVSRSVVKREQKLLALYGFADASKSGVCAAVYVLATYNDGTTSQNLLMSKSCIAPKNVSVQRLELVAAHTLAKLVNHVNQTLRSYDLQQKHMWSDSITFTTLYHRVEINQKSNSRENLSPFLQCAG